MGYKSNIENLTIDATGKLSSPTGVIAGAGVSTLDASAILEADSTTKGFLPPRMTTAQRNAISSPSEGLVVYNTDTDNLNFYSGSTWKEATIDPTSNGLVVRTNSGASSSRTITAGSGISISNGNGVSGNPTISNSGVLSVVAGTGLVLGGTSSSPSLSLQTGLGEIGTYSLLLVYYPPDGDGLSLTGLIPAGTQLPFYSDQAGTYSTNNYARTNLNTSGVISVSFGATVPGTWRAMHDFYMASSNPIGGTNYGYSSGFVLALRIA